VWPAYFGHANIGSIRGFATPLMLGFSAVGAPLTGMAHDWTGTFVYAWIVGTACLGIATLLLLITPKPVPLRSRREGTEPAATVS
jgi:hypothetical protein